jgi:hypothetical protein
MNRTKEYNIYQCLTCEGAESDLDYTGMKQHLMDVHKLDTKNMQGVREMLMHIDGADFYIWKWQWTLDSGVKFLQETCSKRKGKFGG